MCAERQRFQSHRFALNQQSGRGNRERDKEANHLLFSDTVLRERLR